MYLLNLIANKQIICQKILILLFEFRKLGNREKLDGKAEIEEKIDKNSEAYPSSTSRVGTNRDTYSPRNKGTSWVDWS